MRLNNRIRQWLRLALCDLKPRRSSRRRLRRHHGPVESLETRVLLTTFSVANLNDAGPGSLRDAISQANTNPGADTITFATSGKITLSSGQIQITDSLTLIGNGAANTIIDGNLSSRIFDITNAGGDVTINDLTLRNGRTTRDDTPFNGGAIRNLSSGSLAINRSTFSGNSVAGYNVNGGAIYTATGMIVISESTFSQNTATGTFGNGGAVCSQSGRVSLRKVTFSGNSTAGSESRGGAVATISGAMTASACTFSNNTTSGYSGDGGAIFSYTGAVTISQCTLSGNTVTGTEAQGGAVHVFEAPLTISQSTLTDNHATKSSGGGVYIYSGTTPLIIQNSIIAGNSDVGIAPDMRCLQAGTTTVTNSLVGRETGTGLTATVGAIPDAKGNFVGGDTDPLRIDPKLGPLANNGGPTQTHALLAGGLAIDHGSNAAAVDVTQSGSPALATDQRGNPVARIANTTVDMGTYELFTLNAPIVVSTNVDELDGNISSGHLSLREAILLANSSPGANTITFASSTNGTVFDLSLGQMEISEAVTITGNGASRSIIDAQQLSRIFAMTETAGNVTLSDMTLKNGRTKGTGTGFYDPSYAGGAMLWLSSGALTLNRTTFTGNSTLGDLAGGGAILVAHGALVVNESSFSGNSTAGVNSEGGAISAQLGSVLVRNSTFSGNSTTGDYSEGGAIFSLAFDTSMIQSTISGNIASGVDSQGGGLFTQQGNILISQSTITGNNSSISDGGGIFTLSSPINIVNSIVAGNSDSGASSDVRKSPDAADAFLVSNSLIGRNNGTGLVSTQGAVADANGNLIGGATPQTALNPQLGPLQNNGGPTLTHAILSGSPAIDRGRNAAAIDVTNGNVALTTDQRGVSFNRILDGDHLGAAIVDMGAVEFSGLRVTSPNPDAFAVRPTFQWTPIAGATSYSIQINNESTGAARFHIATSNSSTYTPSVDLAIGKFKMWIRPNFAAGPGNWSVPYMFNNLTSPTWTTISATQPTSRPTLIWNGLPGAVRYELWITDISRNVSPVYHNSNVTGTSWMPVSDLPLGRYYAWIRGIAADGMAATWSARIEFLILQPPTVTQGQNSTFDRTPTFGWNSLSGAVKYEVFVRNQTTGATTLYQKDIVALSFTPTSPLPDGPYRWWAVGISAQNIRSLWTIAIDFYVGGKTSLTAPVGSISSTKPIFQWRPVDGAARYDLFVNRDGGQAQIIRQQNLTGASFSPTTSLPIGVYRAWIRAFSNSGEAGIWSDLVTFTIAHADSSIDSKLNVRMPVSLLSNLRFRIAPENQKRIEEKASLQTDTTDNLIDEFLAES